MATTLRDPIARVVSRRLLVARAEVAALEPEWAGVLGTRE